MITIIQKNEIIVKFKDGLGIKTIARDLGISKNTVRSYIREYQNQMNTLSEETDKAKIAVLQEMICSKPVRKTIVKNCTVFTKDVETRFLELIKKEERDRILGPNKQNLTAALLWRTLVNEGYKVGKTTIRKRFREYKHKNPECFIRQSYDYGQRVEYDFHEVKVIMAGSKKAYQQSTISLPKSNFTFGLLYKNQKMETFLDSIVKFIDFCNGVPEEMVFDNMSNVVKRFVGSSDKELTDDILKISNYYGFRVITTNPRSGNEKGHVENSGKTVRRDIFSLKYQFDSEEELQEYYQNELAKRNEPFIAEFQEEIKHLKQRPIHKYELGRMQHAKVNSYGLISIDSNFYSIPDRYIGQTVNCNIYIDFIIVYDEKAKMLCKHNKKDGKGEYSIDIMHYIDTFLKKPGALKNSLALKQAPKILQTIFHQYFSTKPKEFLHFLINTDNFDNIDETAMELGLIPIRNRPKLKPKYLGLQDDYTIDEVSRNQLSLASELFGQEG
ncbi:MAG TPA: IS21 family transposase [Gallicola sp.]|nr:IS21 family transposase [Gallicola sp.]